MFAVTLSGEHEKSGAQKKKTENWTSDSSWPDWQLARKEKRRKWFSLLN